MAGSATGPATMVVAMAAMLRPMVRNFLKKEGVLRVILVTTLFIFNI
jgi:hypothetical protein